MLAGFTSGALAQDARPQPAAPVPGETAIGTEAALLLALPDAEAGPETEDATRPSGPTEKTFTIATWHLEARDPAESETAPREAAPEATWRHTFGSELRTARWREIKAAGFDADVIALQGVRAAADARRLFEARSHHVVVSRQLLARSNAQSTGIAVFRDAAPATTALAYRRQRGVRLTGFRHFLPDAASVSDGAGQEAAAITAFRLNVYGRLVWLASLDLGEDCAGGPEGGCAGGQGVIAAFVDWANTLDGAPAPILLLGRWPQTIEAALETAGYGLHAVSDDGRPDCRPQAGRAVLALKAGAKGQAVLEGRAAPEGSARCARISRLTMVLRDASTAAGEPVPDALAAQARER